VLTEAAVQARAGDLGEYTPGRPSRHRLGLTELALCLLAYNFARTLNVVGCWRASPVSTARA